MPLSRRGLFGVLAAAPAAAVGMVALPAKGEAEPIKVTVTVDDGGLMSMLRAQGHATYGSEGEWRSERSVKRRYDPAEVFLKAHRQGDWRAR